MSRALLSPLLMLSVALAAPTGMARLVLADAAGTCQERCLADERECLASAACTAGTAGEQKECRRVCDQTYTLCVEACG
jgi:hypothetical protein